MVKLIGAMVVVTLMLAVASLAEATCAWVLWAQHIRPGDPKDGGGRWALVRAVPRYEDCELQLRAEVHRAGEQQKHGAPRPGGVVEATQFHCLPDTIDPRGPKGGR
jgi:hypothetical protein